MRGQFLSILSRSGYKMADSFYMSAAWFPITSCFTYFHLKISWSFFLKLLSSSARSGDSGNSASSRTLEFGHYNKKSEVYWTWRKHICFRDNVYPILPLFLLLILHLTIFRLYSLLRIVNVQLLFRLNVRQKQFLFQKVILFSHDRSKYMPVFFQFFEFFLWEIGYQEGGDFHNRTSVKSLMTGTNKSNHSWHMRWEHI